MIKFTPAYEQKAVRGTPFQILMQRSTDTGTTTLDNLINEYGDLRLLRQIVDKIGEIGSAVRWWVADIDGQEIIDHPLARVMEFGNAEFSGVTMRGLIIKYLCIADEAILLKRDAIQGQPLSELLPIPPNWVRQRPILGQGFWQIDVENGKTITIPSEDICHIKNPDLRNPYGEPRGVAGALGGILETDKSARAFTRLFFENNARPDLIIMGGGTEATELKKEEAEHLEETWLQKLAGPFKKHKPLFLSKPVTIKELSQPLKDLALDDINDSDRDAILEYYGLPPEIAGIIDNSNRATAKEAMNIALRLVIVPKLELIRSELDRTLTPLFDENISLRFENPIKEDMADKIEIMSQHPHAFNFNEIRQAAGQPLIDGGDDLFAVPFNLVIGDLDESQPQDRALTAANRPQERAIAIVNRKTGLTGAQALITKQGPDPADIGIVLSANSAADAATAEMTLIIQEFGDDVFTGLAIEPAFTLADPKVVEFLRTYGADRVTNLVDETTRRALSTSLSEGVLAGESFDQLAARVQSVFDVRLADAERIARTETVRGANFGAEAGMSQAGVEDKMWLVSPDSRVRDTHVAIDGVIVPVGENFKLFDGDEGPAPGQFSRAENSINCRCAIIAVTPESREAFASVEKRALANKIFDEKRLPFERVLRRIFKQAFRDQERAILALLEEL